MYPLYPEHVDIKAAVFLKTSVQEEAGLEGDRGLKQPQDRSLGPIAETETAERDQDLEQTSWHLPLSRCLTDSSS